MDCCDSHHSVTATSIPTAAGLRISVFRCRPSDGFPSLLRAIVREPFCLADEYLRNQPIMKLVRRSFG